MTPKQIFDSKADKDQIDPQASADTKSRRRLIFPKRGTGLSNKTGPSPEPTDGQEKEDSVEADAQSIEKKESIFQDIPEKFSEIIGKILPEDQDDLLTRELLSYLNERLESGEEPDWDYITCGSDSGIEKFLLPVHQKYITNYLLGNLLKADYIEGFVVEDDGNSKRLRVTTGMQITANGRKRLKELTGMGRITALLRIIKDCTPGCNCCVIHNITSEFLIRK